MVGVVAQESLELWGLQKKVQASLMKGIHNSHPTAMFEFATEDARWANRAGLRSQERMALQH